MVHAQATVTWDGSTNATWTQPDSTSWSGATYQSGDTAVFAGAGPGTVTITGTVTPGQINVTSGSYTLSGVIGGGGGIDKSGSGTLTLSGTAANTYAGATIISGGTLSLNKSSSGIVAVPGDLTMSGNGTRLTLANNLNGQIGDTAAVTINAPGGVFNGTAPGATTGVSAIIDTIGSLTVSAGQFNTGVSVWTVSGAGLIDGTGVSADTRFTAFSGSSISFGSLTIQGMADSSTASVANRGFFLGGNSLTTQTTLAIGSGGLTLDGSVMKLGATIDRAGSRLVLDGDVTVSGSAESQINRTTTSGGTAPSDVELSGTAGSFTRTFTVADATSSAAPDLTVTARITNGAATAGGLAKAGLGTLLLSASNTYTGPTNVLAGTLALGQAAAVAGSSGLNIAAGATLDLSALGSGLSLGSGQSLGGAGSILGSLAFGSGSSLVFSTTDTLALANGTASFFAGTPGSRFGIDDLLGISSSTPAGTYTLISGTVDTSNLDNFGVANAYALGGGVSAFFQQGSLQVVVVPEPAGLAACGLGLGLAGALARRRRR